MKKKICIAVLNTFINDARVNRTVNTLKEYFDVSVVAESYNKYSIESIDNYKLFRFYSIGTARIKFLPFRFLYWQIIKRIQLFLFAYKIFKSNDFNILYCNDLDTLITLYPFKSIFKVKVVYDTHELWIERTGSKKTIIHRIFNTFEYYLESYLIKRVDKIITVSDGIASELKKRYKFDNISIIRNLDIKKDICYDWSDEVRLKYNIPEEAVLLIHWGTMIESRGIPELIDAMDLLTENYHLLLMGSCPSKRIRTIIDNQPRTHFTGFIPQNKLFEYTAAGDIGIHPMKTDKYLNHYLTFPNKFSQFLNAGLAVILYDSLESRKIMNRCNSGLILDTISPNSIKECILELTSGYNLHELKKNARKCFLQYYSWDIDKDKLLEAVGEL